jgi:Cu/Zn superoxide dismutase
MHTEEEQKTEHFGDLPSFVMGRESELVTEYAATTKSETVLLKSAQ